MIASPLTLARLLNRLPDPRRASLGDLGHASAMAARGRLATQPHEPALAERLEALKAWLAAATEHCAGPGRKTA